jgi:transcription antitermination factor NusG
MIPISEMTDVMKACQVMKECPVEPKQWVRIAKGPFKGDLALVEKVLNSFKVILRVLPRIPDSWFNPEAVDFKKVPQTFRGLNILAKGSELVRIPQRLFNPSLVKNECRKEYNKALKKNVYLWKDMMFRNGFLFHEFRISKLVIEDVCPMLEEVRKFQVDMNLLDDIAGYSDLDEWDLMKDETVVKTVWNEKRLKIQIGDRCKVIDGPF